MAQRELTPADYIGMLKRRWILIAVLASVGGPLAYGVSRFLPSRYKSQTLVLVEQPTVPVDLVRPVVSADISERLASMKQQILSRTRLESIVRQFGLYSGEINKTSMDDLVARLHEAIKVDPVEQMAETRAAGLPGFTISVTMGDAKTAQEVCSAVTSMFIEENLRLRMQHSEDTTQFLVQQLADAKAKLDEQDGKLAVFKSRYIGSLPDDEQANLNLLGTLNSQLDAATQAVARAQQDKSFAESMLSQQIAAWQASQTGHNPETLEQQLVALQTQLVNLQSRYTDDYPDVIKVKGDIAALQAQIAQKSVPKSTVDQDKAQRTSVEPVQIAQLRAQIHQYDQAITERSREQDQIKQQIKLYQSRIQSSPAVEQQYKELTRGYQTALESYNDLLKKRDSSAMATDLERKQEGEQFLVLDPANLPSEPFFPNRPLFALGGFGGGLALGLGLAFLLEMRNTFFRTERDVEFFLHLPVLAMVPSIEPESNGKVKKTVRMRADDSGLTADARS
jgi:polysaccharide chain length determinant protein (PEP-CTERM system associated)